MGKKKTGGGIFGDMFKDSSPKKAMKTYRKSGASGYKREKVAAKAKDVAIHDIVGRPRNVSEKMAARRKRSRTNKKILRAVKRRLFW